MIKRLVTLLSLFLLFLYSTAQAQSHGNSATVVVTINDSIVPQTTTEPEFPGGSGALNNYLQQNVTYPEAASQAQISGRVFVSYVIDTVGHVTDVKILKGIGYGCDEEALRVVRAMPSWKPGTQSGKAIPVRYNIPIRFPVK
ncbi:energy transducer TonB [Spirosoma validum]|uniref:Energy transducer TonB n=1 Tax=Spirosoma validum TaxID=2771355 RepID=A0A927GET0_9BACT|nr:energy transducer TonB [Spirosoma validum]MBD2755003.1 energy transducer TonB [Spirosoma validum]